VRRANKAEKRLNTESVKARVEDDSSSRALKNSPSLYPSFIPALKRLFNETSSAARSVEQFVHCSPVYSA
jgi:hypothetical protein